MYGHPSFLHLRWLLPVLNNNEPIILGFVSVGMRHGVQEFMTHLQIRFGQ